MAARKTYPWDAWFSRRRFRLAAGLDYSVSTSTMIQIARNAASKRGLHVRIVADEDGFTVLRVDKVRSRKAGARQWNGRKQDAVVREPVASA